jgi:hypothetical protein
VGEAGARELRQLQRELERMATIAGADAKHHATRKLRSRVEQGEFMVLFSGVMDELMEQTAENARLVMEPDCAGVGAGGSGGAEWRRGRGKG